MEDKGIQDLVPFKGPIPITVRVIRKYSVQWNPREKRKLFYLFTDSKGHAVEAKVDTRKKRLDSQVFLYRCYRVTGYVVDPPLGFCQVVDAPATIVIGDRTVFQPVDVTDIPKQYFNFIRNEDLKEKSEQIEFLIDSLQLESTSATTIDVDLAIEGYADNIKRLKDIPKKDTISFGFQTEEDIRSNITTLANVLSREPASVHEQNHRFACIAAIKEIHGYRTWYSSRCPGPQCNDTVRYEDDRLMCKHCGYLDKPTYRYCVNATLYSDRSTLPVVFFDSVMTQVLGIDCETLVVREGYTDPKVVPKPMLALIGMEKIYSFSEYLIPNSSDALATLIDFIYDSDTMDIPNPIELSKKAIVCPRNDTVDEGTTIEAKVQTKRNKLDSHITLYNCYNIDGYVVDPNIGYRQVVPQTATIVIGDRTVFKSTTELPIPKHYFNFVAYKDLQSMQKQSLLLTDYLCRVESTSTMMKKKDYNLMKISTIDLSGQVIEITLWEDIGYKYVNSLRPGMVTAITSLIVTTHGGKLQLESTTATTVEIEPPVEGIKESTEKLKRMPKLQTIVYGQQTDKDIRDNITTLQNVVSMNPDSIDNYRFACKATVKEFHGYRKWYRRKCPNSDCDDTLRPEEDYLLCKHCGRIDNPIYTYCVNGTLDDGTATLPVVFFDNAMTQAIGIDCETMVLKNGYEDPKVVPNPILSLAGQEKIYSFSMHKNKDASIQKTLEVDSATSTQEVEDISHRPIATAPATPAAKISRKQPTYDPGKHLPKTILKKKVPFNDNHYIHKTFYRNAGIHKARVQQKEESKK
ncbi:hypothetical protein SSX86_016790 [Deinandra increscens subsp. villosa]|uniref:Replication factor A C-terminal domain-containing protein n=1 Tax=Deinandra increscens subsp. villosa TaxID=3103831 RepID=A0AAP0D3B8_9ASTR